MVTVHPHPPYRYRVVAHGGRADGMVVDCKTLEWAMRWYRILLVTSIETIPNVGQATGTQRALSGA